MSDRTSTEIYHRLPGLFHRTELGQVIGPGIEFLIEEAGHDCCGLELFVVYRKEPLSFLTDALARGD